MLIIISWNYSRFMFEYGTNTYNNTYNKILNCQVWFGDSLIAMPNCGYLWEKCCHTTAACVPKPPFYCLFLLNLLILSSVVVCSFSLTCSVTHSRSFFLPFSSFCPFPSFCHFVLPSTAILMFLILITAYIYNFGAIQTVYVSHWQNWYQLLLVLFYMKYFCWVKVFEEGPASSHPLA